MITCVALSSPQEPFSPYANRTFVCHMVIIWLSMDIVKCIVMDIDNLTDTYFFNLLPFLHLKDIALRKKFLDMLVSVLLYLSLDLPHFRIQLQ